jgi:hypothetical protein
VELVTSEPDPVRARRARIARGVRYAQRAGYAALAVSVVSFVIAAATDFPAVAVDVSIAALVAACLILPSPIVLGYGVRAAEREERQARRQGYR